jgi:hypothetical protein
MRALSTRAKVNLGVLQLRISFDLSFAKRESRRRKLAIAGLPFTYSRANSRENVSELVLWFSCGAINQPDIFSKRDGSLRGFRIGKGATLSSFENELRYPIAVHGFANSPERSESVAWVPETARASGNESFLGWLVFIVSMIGFLNVLASVLKMVSK